MTASVRREDVISRGEAAALLDIHVNTVDRWAKKAGLKKYRKHGDNRVFYLRSEIDEKYVPIVEVP